MEVFFSSEVPSSQIMRTQTKQHSLQVDSGHGVLSQPWESYLRRWVRCVKPAKLKKARAHHTFPSLYTARGCEQLFEVPSSKEDSRGMLVMAAETM